MQNSSIIKTWSVRIILTIGLIVAGLVGATILTRLGIFNRVESVLVVLLLGGGAYIIYRQYRISKLIRQQSTQFWDLAEFEKGIGHQLQRTTVQIDEISSKNAARIDDYSIAFKKQIGTLRKRVEDLESSAAAAGTLQNAAAGEEPPANADAKQKSAKKGATKKSASEKDTRLAAALEGDTLRLHLQPIVELPSRNPTYFETSMQLKLESGDHLGQAEFDELANADGIKPVLDTKMLFSSVRMLRTLKSLKKTSGIFCQLSRASLAQTKSFNTILEFLQANKTLKKSLILEISQQDFETLNRKELKRFDSIADLGFPLALGQVQNLDIPVESIAAYGFEFIKIPIEIILQAGIDEDQNGFHAMPIASTLREHKVSVVASNVKQESEAISLIDMNMAYGQGNLFAPPRPVKQDLLGT